MTASQFEIGIVRQQELSEKERAAVVSLCSRVFEEDYAPALASFIDATHLLGLVDGALVSHALWYTRWLQTGNGPLLRTAYVEGVATEESFRRRGYASSLMERLVGELNAYDLAALSPSRAAFYARLGWELWDGPLFIRTETGLLPSPLDEQVMIYRLPGKPQLDIRESLSAEWREGELW
ncbi:MAG: GNAT family N-acetyltransferase [Caldilineaceae bacterium]